MDRLLNQISRLAVMSILLAIAGCGGGSVAAQRASTAPPISVQFPALTVIDVYGDSTTAGWDGATQAYIDQSAPKIIASITGATVNNFGKSGAMADDFAIAWPDRLAKSTATIVILNFGMNDSTHCDANHFEWNMRPLITAALVNKAVVLQTPSYAAPIGIVTPSRSECVRQFAAIARKLAAEYKLRIIDAYAVTEPLVRVDPSLLPDGIHPTAALYRTIGEDAARVLMAK